MVRHAMVNALVILLAHAVSALGPSAPPPPDQPQHACVRLNITTTTASWSKEQGWSIDDGSQGLTWSGNASGSDDFACIGSASCTQPPFTQETCLGIGNHTITLTDSFGDGWENGSHVKIGRVDNGPGPILPMTAVPSPTYAVFGYDRTETFYVSAPHPLPPPSQLPPSPPNLPSPLPPLPPLPPPSLPPSPSPSSPLPSPPSRPRSPTSPPPPRLPSPSLSQPSSSRVALDDIDGTAITSESGGGVEDWAIGLGAVGVVLALVVVVAGVYCVRKKNKQSVTLSSPMPATITVSRDSDDPKSASATADVEAVELESKV